MMGSFLTRGLVMVFGYAYPAYECFKTVDKNKPEIEQLRFWCQYWIIVAMLTVFERVGDTFVSWLPMYSEAKLAFFVYLWYPKTKGTTYVYETFVRPYVAKHETEIDRNLLELRARAGDIVVLYWQKAASYGQTRIFEVLQYVASQSSRPRPAQRQPPPAQPQQPPPTQLQEPQQPAARAPQPTTSSRQPATQQSQRPPVRQAASTSQQTVSAQEATTPTAPQPTTSSRQPATQQSQRPPVRQAASTSQQTVSAQEATTPTAPQRTVSSQTSAAAQEPSSQSTQSSEPSVGESMETDTLALTDGNTAAPETIMEDAIRVTRGRLRKTRQQP